MKWVRTSDFVVESVNKNSLRKPCLQFIKMKDYLRNEGPQNHASSCWNWVCSICGTFNQGRAYSIRIYSSKSLKYTRIGSYGCEACEPSYGLWKAQTFLFSFFLGCWNTQYAWGANLWLRVISGYIHRNLVINNRINWTTNLMTAKRIQHVLSTGVEFGVVQGDFGPKATCFDSSKVLIHIWNMSAEITLYRQNRHSNMYDQLIVAFP